MNIRVLIADDHPLVRSGICAELARHMEIEVLGEALNGDEALQLTLQRRPDVLLLDVNMPGMKARHVIRQVKQELPACQVLVVTAYGDRGTVSGMLKAGADGYLLKDEDPYFIYEAIKKLASGETWLSPAVADNVIEYAADNPKMLSKNQLTLREVEVLRLLVDGKSNKDIALELEITERTVESHLTNILEKMGAKSRLEAALWANNIGLI
jgi:DNA-binding NarL/FixJ family response regulator